MKTRIFAGKQSGFTLIELLVAMAITTLIVTILVSITAVATDTWSRSRAELRASRQAKAMVDALAKDFESMVTRRGNTYEWLVAKRPTELPGNSKLTSTNAAELVFFTSPTDRYGGNLEADHAKGDVCGVGYLLDYKDPIAGGETGFSTFVLNRYVADPGETPDNPGRSTFDDLLAKKDLLAAFDAQFSGDLRETENFVCENVYQFTVVFHVEVPGMTLPAQVMVGGASDMVSEFRFKGTGIEIGEGDTEPNGLTPEQLKSGRMVGVEVSLSVLKDSAIGRIRKGVIPTDPTERAKYLTTNSFNYSKFIKLTSL